MGGEAKESVPAPSLSDSLLTGNSDLGLIQERVLEKEFVGYSKEEMTLTEDGLWLPDLPAWLNVTRERQDDGSWGVFMVRPSKEDVENRWSEILEAMEPVGIEIGAIKIALPSE